MRDIEKYIIFNLEKHLPIQDNAGYTLIFSSLELAYEYAKLYLNVTLGKEYVWRKK